MKKFVYINPTASALEGTEENAVKNMRVLISECDQGLSFVRNAVTDGRGYFGFDVSKEEYRQVLHVRMPGLELSQVRYTGTEEQDVRDFPRLFVGGNSWWWKLALTALEWFEY